ncbi:MAG: hypothetical protein OEX15_08760 [Gammaproteobacteria bacterium]|nr:hypothetical protein [Gammaproteobacteria bacterium]
MKVSFRWMIPVATAGSVLAIAFAWLYYNAKHEAGTPGTFVPFLAAIATTGGLTATSIYWLAPDGERSKASAFFGGLATAAVTAGALIAMMIEAFGS